MKFITEEMKKEIAKKVIVSVSAYVIADLAIKGIKKLDKKLNDNTRKNMNMMKDKLKETVHERKSGCSGNCDHYSEDVKLLDEFLNSFSENKMKKILKLVDHE